MERDCGQLNDTQLTGLKTFLPSKTEALSIETCAKEGGATKFLGTCEKYMAAVISVDKAAEKIECMIFKQQFYDRLKEIMDSLGVACACDEVHTSVNLKTLLAIILSVGNKMNGRDTGGLKLHDRLKLEEVRFINSECVSQHGR